MVDKLAYMTETEWIALLDEIRKKGGTTDKMTVEQARQAVEALKIGGEDKLLKVINQQDIGDYVVDGVQYINDGSFYGVTANSVTLTDATYLYDEVFKKCNINTINIPKVISVNSNTFNKARFTTINAPSLKKINGFQNLRISGQAPVDLNGLSHVEVIYGDCFSVDSMDYFNKWNIKNIPEFVEFKNVKELTQNSFKNYQYSKKLSFPNAVSDSYGAVTGDKYKNNSDDYTYHVLEELSVPKLLYVSAQGCKALKKITININAKISRYGFDSCNFFSFVLKGAGKVGDNAFHDNKNLKYVKLQKNTVDYDMFDGCSNLKAVWISKDVNGELPSLTDAPDVNDFKIYVEAENAGTLGDRFYKKTQYVNYEVVYGVTEEQFNEICKADNGGVEVPFDGIIYVDDNGNEVK